MNAVEYARRSWEKDLKAAGLSDKMSNDLVGKPDVVQRLYASYEKATSRRAEVRPTLASWCIGFIGFVMLG